MARTGKTAFTHGTSIGEGGELLFDAPIEIHDKTDLENYHIGWKDCVTIKFGGYDPRRIYFFKTPNQELADFLWKQLNNEHAQGVAVTRCMIPGTRKNFIRCPTSNACERCPFGVKPQEKQLNIISWTRMTEQAWEMELEQDDEGKAKSPVQGAADFNLMLCDLRTSMDEEGPRLYRAFEMKELLGMPVSEIAATLDCSQPRVYQLVKQAKEMARDYLAEND